MREYLFYELDWFGVVEHQKRELQKKINSLSEGQFQGADLNELAEDLAGQYSLVPPVLNCGEIAVSQREVDVDVSGDRSRYFSRGGPHFVKGTEITVRIPFTGDAGMFRVKPTTFNYNPPMASVQGKYVVFTIHGTNLTQEQVRARIDETVKSISEYLGFQQNSVGRFPEELRSLAVQALQQRQSKLRADADLISGLGYRVTN